MKPTQSARLSHNQFRIILKLLPFLWGDSWKVRIPLLFAVILVFCNIGLSISIPLIMSYLIKLLTPPISSTAQTVLILLSYGIIWTLSQFTNQMREIILFRPMEHSISLLSMKIFDHLHKLSLRFHVGRKTGMITNSIERAQKALPNIIWGIFLFLIPTVLEISLAIIILWRIYPFMYGTSLLVILLSYIFFSIVAMEWSVKAQRISNQKEAQANGRIVDSLLNYETVKYFNDEQYEKIQCHQMILEREDAATKKHISAELIHLGQGILIGSGLTFMTYMAGTAVINGTMQVDDFVLINGYILQFVTPLSYFGYMLRQLRKGMTDVEHIFEMLDQQPEIVDGADAPPLVIKQASIEFDHVSFGYDARRLILKGVSFTVAPGTTTAIVGSSGAGKSTIARLLFRFYDVLSGRILIDGQDLRLVTQESVRAAIGIVPQDTVLFNNTLYYNIAYGNPIASVEEVNQSIKLAHLDSFISQLPEGTQTMVGERGLKLSGGEKQRVAIARVILKKPSIYIFDEATSALDTHTEREIQGNLEEISSGSTTLIIAHRLSTVVHADQIVVLDHGKVVERGTHEALIAQKGVYAYLWSKQIKEQANSN